MRLIHFYPHLMNLYGSYANVWALRRLLEQLGHAVTVEAVAPGEPVSLAGADFLFLGAGTERAQKAALSALSPLGGELKAAAADGVAMLFAGSAMELLGASITDADGVSFDGLGLAPFTTVQGRRRIVEDVYGHTALFEQPIVGFMNKSGLVSGVETPLLARVELGFGNDGPKAPEGFHRDNVYASQLTGPLLVKNPRLLEHVAAAICRRRGLEPPAAFPRDPYAQAAYAVTEEQLRLRR